MRQVSSPHSFFVDKFKIYPPLFTSYQSPPRPPSMLITITIILENYYFVNLKAGRQARPQNL
jgi:hypothetical protein